MLGFFQIDASANMSVRTATPGSGASGAPPV